MVSDQMKTISHDDFLRLLGLLTLAADYRKKLVDIERSARAITGDKELGHTGDAVWADVHSARSLLAALGITVEPPQVETTALEDAAHQAEKTEP